MWGVDADDLPAPARSAYDCWTRSAVADVVLPVTQWAEESGTTTNLEGRVLAQYQSGAQTRRVPELNAAAPGAYVQLHPRLADRLGITDSEPVAVTSRRGRAVAPALISRAIRADTVFMPFHWAGEGRANTLTNPALDPTSRMPEFKVCAVRVEAAGHSPE